jgi:hypothetical protein
MLNNIDKKLEPIGDNEETKRLADLEKIEFDVMQNLADTIKEDFIRERKEGQSFTNWLQSKPDDYFITLELSDGGKVVDIRQYFKTKDPKIKKINLADHFKLNQTVADLSDSDVELVNRLLQMTLNKDK